MESFIIALNSGVKSLVESTIGMYLRNIMDVSKECIRIPVILKGLGMYQVADFRFAQFVDGILQGVMNLMDRFDR